MSGVAGSGVGGTAGDGAVEIDAIAPQPWRNGGGLTREVAAWPPGAAAFDWRVSVAEIDADGPFSGFPGLSRHIALLRGAGLRLRDGAGGPEHRLDALGALFAFDGASAVRATLPGGPVRVLNLMCRRGAAVAAVEVLDAARDLPPGHAGGATLLLPLRGAWQLDGPRPALLRPGTLLLSRPGASPPRRAAPEPGVGAPRALLARLRPA